MNRSLSMGRMVLTSFLWAGAKMGSRLFRKNKLRILTYHRIGQNDRTREVLPESFEEELSYLSMAGYKSISLEELCRHLHEGAPIQEKSIALTFDDGYGDHFRYTFPLLQRYGFNATFFIAVNFVGGSFEGTRMLSWAEVMEMSNVGINFGSHTLTHPLLTRISTEEARREVALSKKILQEKIGRVVNFFCYPYGDVDRRIRDLVEESGYDGACSQITGGNYRSTDLFLLRRTHMSPKDSLLDFRSKLDGAFDPLYWAYYYYERLFGRLKTRGGQA